MVTTHSQITNRNTKGRQEFLREVFPEELKEIKRRREAVGVAVSQAILEAVDGGETGAGGKQEEPSPSEETSWSERIRSSVTGWSEKISSFFRGPTPAEPAEAQPSTELELVGLAFSGGGIRSATFNLGVLQALAKHGLLKYADYLSTVSGGGYIGSCLSSLLNTPYTGPEGDPFPFRHQPGVEEPLAIRHLRNSGNYLAPGGLLDKIRIPALLLRGVLINLLVMLPYVVVAVWLTNKIYGDRLRDAVRAVYSGGHFDWKLFYDLTPWAGAVFLIMIVAFPLAQRMFRGRLGLRNGYERSFGFGLLVIFLVALVESLPTVLLYLRLYQWDKTSGELSTLGTVITALIPYVFAGRASGTVSKWGGQLALYALGVLGPLILLLIYFRLAFWHIFFYSDGYLTISWISIYWGAFLLFVYARLSLDVNVTSLHGFYRDRLSKAYLFQVDKRGEIVPKDELNLSGLNARNTKAPYQVINVALNLQGSEDPNLRGRNSDFFILSKHFVGSERTGFCRTEAMEQADGHLNLGTAVAISGAAAAPNMGTTTIKPLVFIMTLLNIRLGYWLPNPSRVKTPLFKRLPLLGVGPVYLLKELFSKMDEKSRYVNLSDGGHIENLAVYELLRRRCKYIIACDAEADPSLTFGGLATLIRYARIDMAIDIEIELDDVRKRADGLSRKHCALGKIHYGDGQVGYLLYIKSSVTGDENEYIQQYRSRHPEFPHESTADQFFDEAQFEAYRALGHHITNELFHEPEQEVHVADWFEDLESSLRPRFQMEETFVDLQKQLSALERQFLDPDVAEYTYQIYPELLSDRAPVPAPPASDEAEEKRYRKIFHLCNLQMQLMENVFIVLQLDKPRNRDHHFNRGWMNLFRRWAQAPYFRRAWAVSIGTYSVGFQMFCEEALKLSSTIQWRLVERGREKEELTQRERYHLTLQERKGRLKSIYATVAGQPVMLSQIWVAEMSVQLIPGATGFGSDGENETGLKETFPIGLATINLSQYAPEQSGWAGYQAELMYYRIQDYYRQMRLLERMIPTLRETLANRYEGLSRFRVNFSEEQKETRLRYSYFFERYGFESPPRVETP